MNSTTTTTTTTPSTPPTTNISPSSIKDMEKNNTKQSYDFTKYKQFYKISMILLLVNFGVMLIFYIVTSATGWKRPLYGIAWAAVCICLTFYYYLTLERKFNRREYMGRIKFRMVDVFATIFHFLVPFALVAIKLCVLIFSIFGGAGSNNIPSTLLIFTIIPTFLGFFIETFLILNRNEGSEEYENQEKLGKFSKGRMNSNCMFTPWLDILLTWVMISFIGGKKNNLG